MYSVTSFIHSLTPSHVGEWRVICAFANSLCGISSFWFLWTRRHYVRITRSWTNLKQIQTVNFQKWNLNMNHSIKFTEKVDILSTIEGVEQFNKQFVWKKSLVFWKRNCYTESMLGECCSITKCWSKMRPYRRQLWHNASGGASSDTEYSEGGTCWAVVQQIRLHPMPTWVEWVCARSIWTRAWTHLF